MGYWLYWWSFQGRKVQGTNGNIQREAEFVGDWTYRNTMSRLSTEKALWTGRSRYGKRSLPKTEPFRCAVQIELSAEFRRMLYTDEGRKTALGRKYIDELGHGLHRALNEACKPMSAS